MIKKILKPLASLKLTVVLFALSIFLVFAGTLVQVNKGIWTVVDEYFRSLVVTIEFQIFVPQDIATVGGAFWFPGGLTLGTLMFVNLIAAHSVRFKLTKKRAGIIITHFGVILLLVGEFVTGFAAEEGNMTIVEGQSANYTEDSRSSEMVVVDQSDPNDDLVIAIPDGVIRSRDSITHGLFPFTIEINEWMENSQILGPMQATSEQKAKADTGVASDLSAVSVPRANGVDGQTIDAPSVYVTIMNGEERLGAYLLSVYVDQPQAVTVGDRTYWIDLRFKRSYKSYSLHLKDFKFDRFTGTQMARNFSSTVQLVDEGRNVDREVLIYMNHPLRHAGETFYQSSYLRDESGTVLQVVKNPGWLIPYISCTVATIGMLLHFGIRLVPATRRQSK